MMALNVAVGGAAHLNQGDAVGTGKVQVQKQQEQEQEQVGDSDSDSVAVVMCWADCWSEAWGWSLVNLVVVAHADMDTRGFGRGGSH
jgi:hypothetical protein